LLPCHCIPIAISRLSFGHNFVFSLALSLNCMSCVSENSIFASVVKNFLLPLNADICHCGL
jgi:hypothetical protein